MWGNKERNDFLLINEKKIAAIAEFLGIFFETRPANNERLVANLHPVPFKTEGVPCGTEPHKPFGWVNGVEITRADFDVLTKLGIPIKIEYEYIVVKKKGKK